MRPLRSCLLRRILPPLLFWGSCLLAFSARGEEAFLPDDSPSGRRAVVDAIAARLESSYVLAEVASQMADALRARAARGDYDGVDSPEVLAQTLTTELRAISQDRHLRVRYHADPAEVMPDWNTPDPDAQARYVRHAERTNFGFSRVEILPGNIGVLRLDEFGDPALGGDAAAAAMRFLAHTDALIIDLRGNGGGGGGMVTVLASYLFGPEPTHLSDFHIRERNETIQVWTSPYVPGPAYARNVYLLVGPRTASAAESFAYMLKNRTRARLVGRKTAGAANPGRFVRVSEHLAVFVPDGRPVDPLTGANWEGIGIEPDVEVEVSRALEVAHALALETLLAGPANSPADREAWGRALGALRGAQGRERTGDRRQMAEGGIRRPETRNLRPDRADGRRRGGSGVSGNLKAET